MGRVTDNKWTTEADDLYYINTLVVISISIYHESYAGPLGPRWKKFLLQGWNTFGLFGSSFLKYGSHGRT